MILELTPEQQAFKESAEQFAREVVAPRAAAIDEAGEFPIGIMREAAAPLLIDACCKVLGKLAAGKWRWHFAATFCASHGCNMPPPPPQH